MTTATKNRLEPISPGEILKLEFMDPLGVNINQLGQALRVSATRVSEIVHGQRKISPDTALRLGRYFGTTPKFWLNLQCSYDLEIAEDDVAQRVYREVQPREAEPALAYAARSRDDG